MSQFTRLRVAYPDSGGGASGEPGFQGYSLIEADSVEVDVFPRARAMPRS
jgi:hypothetical protein